MGTHAGRRARRLASVLVVGFLMAAGAIHLVSRPAPARRTVLIFAAASLQTVLDELTPGIERAMGVEIRTSYAATSALARQIENGAPADLFMSADREWMEYLASRGRIRAASRVDLVGNRLVLVAPSDRVVGVRIAPAFPLAQALGPSRLALADPESVPAGRYARAALMTLGVWNEVSAKLAPAENVRAALVLVARGESTLGIVYRTDAIAEPRVRIVDVFPDDTHPPIVYPVALTAVASADGAGVLDSLQSPRAREAFERRGFLPLR